MQQGAGERHWPSIDDPGQLPDTGERIARAIEEMEECFRREALKLSLSSTENRHLLGHSLFHIYENLALATSPPLSLYRGAWVRTALEEFRGAWHPPVAIFRAIGVDERSRYRVPLNDQEVLIRADQSLAVRAWGIRIDPEDPKLALLLANQILRMASSRLAADISCIDRMCRAHVSGHLPHADQIHWGTKGLGIAFEKLIADILNEEEPHATHASLWEDLFEWTDLRVKYPDLSRKFGARVQVKLIANEVLESQETQHRHQETYVILSPVRLAQYVENCLEGVSDERIDEQFWQSIRGEPADTAELAAALLEVFENALSMDSPHPLGPMIHVPPAIRRLVRSYVRVSSFGATEKMREATGKRPNSIPGWVRRFLKK